MRNKQLQYTYNPISQKKRLSGIEIWSVNRILQDKNFSLKIMLKMFMRLVLELFLVFRKALYKVKASGQHLSFNIFWWTFTCRHS